MAHAHAIVWLDHRTARIAGCDLGDAPEVVEVVSARPDGRVHRKSGPMGSGHAPLDTAFFDEVASALRGVRELLLVGPAEAKGAFQHHLERRWPDVAARVVGVETVDHPSDGELVAFGTRAFARIDALGAPGVGTTEERSLS